MRSLIVFVGLCCLAFALQGSENQEFENDDNLRLVHAPPLAPLPDMTSLHNSGPPGFAPPHDIMVKIRESYLKRKRVHGLSRRKQAGDDDFVAKQL